MQPLVKHCSTSSWWSSSRKKKINSWPKRSLLHFYSFCITCCFYYLVQIYFQRLLYAMGKSIKSLHSTSLFLHLTFCKLEISWCSQSSFNFCFRERERKQVTAVKARSYVWVMIRTADLSLSLNHSQGQSVVDRAPSWQGSILNFSLRLQGRCSSLHNLQKHFRKPTVKGKSKL